jgi:hypothetical protein
MAQEIPHALTTYIHLTERSLICRKLNLYQARFLAPLLVLTPGSKEVLEAIRQAMEAYYLIKYLELEATNPWKGKPIPPPGPEQSNVGSREGYTPDPDDPDPVPWPFPWWHRSNLSILESIVNGKSGQIGAALGDPYPQTNSFDVIKSNAFHLGAATAAL